MIRALILGCCFWAAFSNAAQAQLFLEDGKKVINVSPGERVNGTLLIHNTAGDPAPIRIYWEDFQYKPPYDGTKDFLPAGTTPASASQWVTFSPDSFTMPGFGRQSVAYTVTVPDTIKEGHYGVLFFEKSGAQLSGEAGLTLVERVGCLFFIEPKDKVKKASVENITVDPGVLAADFSNQGNVILIPNTTYYLMQEGGMVISRGQVKKLYVPPGATAHLKIPLQKNLGQGHYTMVINCDLGEGDVTVKEVPLTVDSSGQINTI